MTKIPLPILLFSFLAFLVPQAVKATDGGPTLDAQNDDGIVDQSAVNNSSYMHIYDYQVGALYNVDSGCVVAGFALPYLAPGQQVTGASISWYLESKYAASGGPSYNVQLYGLKRVSTTSSAPIQADWFTGTNDTANTLIAPKFVTPSTPVAGTVTYTGANLAAFVQSQYGNAAFSGMDLSSSRFIMFRLNPDGTQYGYNNYVFSTSRNPLRSHHPMLSLTISNGITAIAGRLQFSFNLPQASDTSAGVYDGTGKLIRTIWSNIHYQAGTNYGVWDGNDDSGNPVAPGTNYQIKLIYHNVQYVWGGVIGNTSASTTGANAYHSFDKMHDMAFSGTFACYSVGYNELEANFHSFVVGAPQVPSEINLGYDFADPFAMFYFCATDGTKSYWAKGYGGEGGANATFVIAITNAGPTGVSTFYTFPKGTVPSGSYNQHYPSCVDFDPTPGMANPAGGLAVQKSGNALFVSHPNLNVVRVFDKVQGNLLGTISMPSPGRMACTANGDVWIISNSSSPSVMRYTFANGVGTLDQTITGLNDPVGVGVSADDSLVLIADGGTSQQVKAFNNATGAAAWTYGALGGMAVNGPNVTTNCFQFSAQRANFNDFNAESFIAFQPDNTFWLDDPADNRVLHFSINGNTLVYIEQIATTDASYRATVDVTDATRVFNGFLEYSVDYSLPVGGTNGSWKLVRNWEYGIPADATHQYYGYEQGFNNVATLPNGRTYGLVLNILSGLYDLYELPASGQLRYTGYTFTTNPRIYEDGTLRYNVTGLNNASISYFSSPLTGFDSNNNPVWGSPELLGTAPLTASTPTPWVTFPLRTEMTSTGILLDFDGNFVDTGYHLGGIPRGGTAFQWLASPTTNSTRTGWFPQDGKFDVGNGVQYAGNFAMALGRNIVYGYHGEFWGAGEASQWVNFYDDGLMVGLFGTFESAATMGADNCVDGFAGNSFSPTMVKCPDGNAYIYCNDESDHGGTCQWKITGMDGVTEISGSGQVGGITSLNGAPTGPTVSLTSPTRGANYVNGNSVVVSASVAGGGAAISSVQFFDGSTSLGSITAAPYSMNVTTMAPGTHSLTATVTDASGNTATSAAVTFTIGTDGQSSPPPAPIALTTNSVTSASVGLAWTQPSASSTSSTIGQIISFQTDSPGDSNALKPTDVAGAPPYNVAHFNDIGTSSSQIATFPTLYNSLGAVVPNLSLWMQVMISNDTNSTLLMTGTEAKLFSTVVNTTNNTPVAITVGNVPFANYDVVVYSLPPNLNAGAQSVSVTVGDGAYHQGTITQKFTTQPTGYTTGTVPFATNTTMTNVNAVVVQGLTSPTVEIQGLCIVGFQIVERPYDQGVPASYNIQRATGTSGTFATIGTGTATSYTDTDSITGAATYQYRVQAVNSYGTSDSSNTVTVTTPGVSTTTTPVNSFSSWQTKYFTAAQLADATISGPNADPYGSGVPNLLAYALQLNPATASTTDVPQPTVQNGHLAITYLVPSAITDVNYIVEVSTDLSTWNSGTGYTQTLSNVTSSAGHTITVQDSLPSTQEKHFMRLRVSQN